MNIIKERNTTFTTSKIKLFNPDTYSSEWDVNYWMNWHAKNWSICIPIAILYVISVYIGVQFMKNRKPYNLRYFLGIWSGLLGIFSILGSYYFLPEIFKVLYNDGFDKAACDNSYKSEKNLLFWAWLFTWSKVFEFGDTLFIILRKQKLTFLHWFHHAMTVICVFAYFPGNCSINRWSGSMNFFIHSIMYSYYSFKAFQFKIPKFISFVITISQIAQMFIGLFVASYILNQHLNNQPCKTSFGESIFSFSIYVSYFILFLNFFLQTYFKKNSQKTALKEKNSNLAKKEFIETSLHEKKIN